MNIAVFMYNTSSAILQFKLLNPFGLVLEKFGVCLKHGTIMWTMIW